MLTQDSKLLLAEVLSSAFEYESSYQTATPSGNYFWYRKRLQVANLVRRNIQKIRVPCNESEQFKFIDIGCGTGVDLFLIRQVLSNYLQNCRFVGIDGTPNSHLVGSLRKEHFKADDVEFEMVDIMQKLPFPDNSFDLVYSSEVVEHLLEPEVLLREMRRILKPNGCFILTTPNEPNIFQKAFWSKKAKSRLDESVKNLRQNPSVYEINGSTVDIYGHVSCRTNKEWDACLQKEGFSLVDYGRGAIAYGGNRSSDRNLVLGLRLLVESILDILPKQFTRSFSDQLIAIYCLSKS